MASLKPTIRGSFLGILAVVATASCQTTSKVVVTYSGDPPITLTVEKSGDKVVPADLKELGGALHEVISNFPKGTTTGVQNPAACNGVPQILKIDLRNDRQNLDEELRNGLADSFALFSQMVQLTLDDRGEFRAKRKEKLDIMIAEYQKLVSKLKTKAASVSGSSHAEEKPTDLSQRR